MMDNQNREMALSEFVDGELSPDVANRLLLEVLPNERDRAALMRQLRLRVALAPWRAQTGDATAESPRANIPSRLPVRSGRLLLAAAMVAAGLSAVIFYMARGGNDVRVATPTLRSDHPALAEYAAARMSQEEAADVLQVHETVTGPVAWLAVSPDSVQVQNVAGIEPGTEVVACFLDFRQKGPGAFSKTPALVICRTGSRATLAVPSTGEAAEGMQIQLVAAYENGKLGVWYAVSVGGRRPNDPSTSSLTGFLPINETSRPIGQLAYDGTTLDFAMSAAKLTQEVRG